MTDLVQNGTKIDPNQTEIFDEIANNITAEIKDEFTKFVEENNITETETVQTTTTERPMPDIPSKKISIF